MERETEEEWLREQGFSEEQIQAFVSQDSNPVITGVY